METGDSPQTAIVEGHTQAMTMGMEQGKSQEILTGSNWQIRVLRED